MEKERIDFAAAISEDQRRLLDLMLEGLTRREIAARFSHTLAVVHDRFGLLTKQFGMRIELIMIEYYLWKNGLRWPGEDMRLH